MVLISMNLNICSINQGMCICVLCLLSHRKKHECRLSQMGNDVTNEMLNSYEPNVFGTDMHS